MNDETHDMGGEGAFASSWPNHPKIHDLYSAPANLTGQEKEDAMEKAREQLLKRIGDIFNPIDSLHQQMKGLDLAFHESLFEAGWNRSRHSYKDAFAAQRLYQESIKLLIKSSK